MKDFEGSAVFPQIKIIEIEVHVYILYTSECCQTTRNERSVHRRPTVSASSRTSLDAHSTSSPRSQTRYFINAQRRKRKV